LIGPKDNDEVHGARGTSARPMPCEPAWTTPGTTAWRRCAY